MNLAATRWAGPILGLAGAVAISLMALEPLGARDLVSWWVLQRAVSVENALPLIGLGAAMAFVSWWQAGLDIAAFLTGAALGFRIHSSFVAFMSFAPNAADHLFLTGPISLIAAGLLLIVPGSLKRWLVTPIAFVIGAMLANIIALTDPTLDGRKISLIGVGLGLWVVTTTFLSIRAFYKAWLPIGFRIVGSWFIAIGLLYGGSSLIARPALPSLPEDNLAVPAQRNEIPQINEPRPGLRPDGFGAEP
jgi:hypothetical protein